MRPIAVSMLHNGKFQLLIKFIVRIAVECGTNLHHMISDLACGVTGHDFRAGLGR